MREAAQQIIKIAAANGVGRVWVGQGGTQLPRCARCRSSRQRRGPARRPHVHPCGVRGHSVGARHALLFQRWHLILAGSTGSARAAWRTAASFSRPATTPAAWKATLASSALCFVCASSAHSFAHSHICDVVGAQVQRLERRACARECDGQDLPAVAGACVGSGGASHAAGTH